MTTAPEPEDHSDDEEWVYPSTLVEADIQNMHLRDRQLKWLKYFAQTGSVLEAARLAGYKGSDESLRVQGYRVKKRLRDPLRALMRAEGLDATVIIKGIKAGFSATKVTRMKVKEAVEYEAEDGEMKTTVQDVIREFVDVDYGTRHRYLNTAAVMYGLIGRNYRGAGTVEATVQGDENGVISAYVGIEAEDDLQAEEETTRQKQSEAEVRGDIEEIRRKIRLVGYELVPLQSTSPQERVSADE